MQLSIIGASGKTGIHLVREALERGHRVAAVCRDSSREKLDEFAPRNGFTLMTAAVVSDEATLTRALAGAAAANGVNRLAFTAGEVTAIREAGEDYTLRQRLMRALVPLVMRLTPYSVADMLQASELISQQPGWNWTIVRAPSLRDMSPTGYRLCKISDITSAHALSRADYAACLIDSLGNPHHHRRTLAVVPDKGCRMGT